jgi:hypothetical protein
MNFFLRFSYFTFFPFILNIMFVPSLCLFPHSTITSFLLAGLYFPISLRFSLFRIQKIYLASNFVLTLPSTLFHMYFIWAIFIIYISHPRYYFLNVFFRYQYFIPFFCLYLIFISYVFICFIPFLHLIYVGSFCFCPVSQHNSVFKFNFLLLSYSQISEPIVSRNITRFPFYLVVASYSSRFFSSFRNVY